MDIGQLQYLVALAREKHFTRAAKACHVTQPTLSGRLRQLEQELGVPIVERGQRFIGFTPDGERLWVPGFDPEYLHPLSGEQGPGAIFTTTHGGESTLWMVLRFSQDEGVAEYARVTPGSRRGIVRVALEATGPASSRARVSYDLTGLSEAGNGVLASMTEAAYVEMLADWQHRIADCLAAGSR